MMDEDFWNDKDADPVADIRAMQKRLREPRTRRSEVDLVAQREFEERAKIGDVPGAVRAYRLGAMGASKEMFERYMKGEK